MSNVAIAVVGPGESATQRNKIIAHAVGAELAIRAFTVVTGGLRGVMQAAALASSLDRLYKGKLHVHIPCLYAREWAKLVTTWL